MQAADQLALAVRILRESENRAEWYGAARIAWDEVLQEHRHEIEQIEHRIRVET
jgi:hypothetical protein